MEFVPDRNQLLSEVAATAHVPDGKNTQPLLSHLLFRTNTRGALSITGSDLKRTVTTECPAAVTTPGEATVPAQKLLNYLKLLPGGKVSMKLLANHQVQVTSGRSRTRMPGLSPNSFPPAPSATATPLRLSSRGLKALIRQSLFAVAYSEDRYLFNAALLLLRQHRMGMVATDGRQLSLVEVQEDSLAIEGYKKVLLPRECMSDLISLFNSSKDEFIDFSEDETTVFFQIGARTLTVRKLVGQFPNYEAIPPRDAMNSVILRSADLLASMQRVLEFADERSSAVKLQLTKNTLTVSASAADRGESHEVLPLSYTAADVTIGFNGQFIVEFLKTIGARRGTSLPQRWVVSGGHHARGAKSGVSAEVCGHADEDLMSVQQRSVFNALLTPAAHLCEQHIRRAARRAAIQKDSPRRNSRHHRFRGGILRHSH